jgi:hypothetical protein
MLSDMTYVGATAEAMEDVVHCLGRLAEDAGTRRARIAALLQEAGETTSTVATLAQLEHWAHSSAADAKQAAELAAADALVCPPSGPAQTGLRASMGLVDDVAFELLFVNDVSRLVFGRDINTGTPVGPGGRAVSALGLIPFGKLAKFGKLASLGTDAAGAATKVDGVLVEGAGSATRVIRYQPGALDPRWGLTRRHMDKHLTGTGPHSLRQIDPDGQMDLWRGYMQDLASRPPTAHLNNDVQDIVGTFPKADGSGEFRFGIRVAPNADGEWDLVTLLTRQ